MAFFIIGDDPNGVVAVADEDLWVLELGARLTHTGDGYSFNGFDDITFIVQGSIEAQLDAVTAPLESQGNSVQVAESSSVTGQIDGIDMLGDANEVINEGKISGVGGDGVRLLGANANLLNNGQISGAEDGVEIRALATVTNTGTISGGGDGLSVSRGGNEIFNSGSISGADVSIRLAAEDGASNIVRNSGTVGETGSDAETVAISGSAGIEEIYNKGSVFGDISLEGGDDVFRGGGQAGKVDGGDGNDALTGGLFDDRFYGSAGDDTVRGGAGDDHIDGGAAADLLSGGSGNDTLLGGNGTDLLYGGKGDDELSGGFKADTFVFGRSAGSDLITDFENGTDLIDVQAFGFDGFVDIAAAVSAVTGGTLIDWDVIGGSGQLFLDGITGTIDAADFVF